MATTTAQHRQRIREIESQIEALARMEGGNHDKIAQSIQASAADLGYEDLVGYIGILRRKWHREDMRADRRAVA